MPDSVGPANSPATRGRGSSGRRPPCKPVIEKEHVHRHHVPPRVSSQGGANTAAVAKAAPRRATGEGSEHDSVVAVQNAGPRAPSEGEVIPRAEATTAYDTTRCLRR